MFNDLESAFHANVVINSLEFSTLERGWKIVINKNTFGVAAPLPGYSKETKESLSQQLQEIKKHILGSTLTAYDCKNLLPNIFPSLVFALQTALLQGIYPNTPTECNIHGLIHLSTCWKEKISCFDTFKIKAKGYSQNSLESLLKKIPGRLRIDFNETLPEKNILNRIQTLPWERIDYVEEPCFSLETIKKIPHPVAVDEKLLRFPLEELLTVPSVQTLILKPTLLGDLYPFIQLSHPIVLSSCYEGPEGVLALRQWANWLSIEKNPQGIDTLEV